MRQWKRGGSPIPEADGAGHRIVAGLHAHFGDHTTTAPERPCALPRTARPPKKHARPAAAALALCVSGFWGSLFEGGRGGNNAGNGGVGARPLRPRQGLRHRVTGFPRWWSAPAAEATPSPSPPPLPCCLGAAGGLMDRRVADGGGGVRAAEASSRFGGQDGPLGPVAWPGGAPASTRPPCRGVPSSRSWIRCTGRRGRRSVPLTSERAEFPRLRLNLRGDAFLLCFAASSRRRLPLDCRRLAWRLHASDDASCAAPRRRGVGSGESYQVPHLCRVLQRGRGGFEGLVHIEAHGRSDLPVL